MHGKVSDPFDGSPVTNEGLRMTNKPNESDGLDARWAELADALAAFRDALTKTSLCLNDCLFEHDVVGRAIASDMAQQLTEKITLQAHKPR